MFEIGSSLREARERQGRSFPDLERKTQIRSRYLMALEEENFDGMPALAYTRGFLRVYADELGLDGQLYVDEFNSRFSVSEEGSAPFRRRDVRPPTRQSRRIASLAVVITLGTIGVILALFVFAFSKAPGTPSPSASTPSTNSSRTKPVSTTTVKITAVRGDVSVEVRAGGPGGGLLFGGTLIRGHSKPFRAARIWVKVSAAQNIRWTLSGGTSVDTGNRFGPAIVLFTPGKHKFLAG
jgi:cytoskeletal protein RodZ